VHRKLLLAIIILPGIVLLTIPVLIVWLLNGTHYAAHLAQPQQIIFWIGLVMTTVDLGLAI